jgi:hypothetical protein
LIPNLIRPLPPKAAELINAYLSDPEHVDWDDVQKALDTALKAFDLPPTYLEDATQRG